MSDGLNDLTWDSAGTVVNIVLGITRIPFQEFAPGDMEIKIDKPATIGEGLARKRTIGRGELADFDGKILATDYRDIFLPRTGAHGGTLIRFPIHVVIFHPSIKGSLAILLDVCRMVKVGGPKLDGTEKALMYDVKFSAMRRYDRDASGNWHGLAYEPRRASSEARAIMRF